MLSGYIYKNSQINSQAEGAVNSQKSLSQIENVISLKKLWSDKKTTKNIKKLKTIVAKSKVKWSRKNKKLKASFSELSARELNKVLTKLSNIPVQIKTLNIKKTASSYSVEFQCKW